MNRPSVFIALRYLLGRGREGGRYLRGAAAGIALSLVPILVTLIVADGMIQGITDRFLELGTGHLQIYDYRSPGGDLPAKAPALASMEGIRGVWPEMQGLGILVGKSGKSGATIRALDDGFLKDGGTAGLLRVVDGSAALSGRREALLGEELARTIGAVPGDTVRIMTTRTTADGRSIPRITPFTVRGIVSAGYRELDALWCLIPYADGEAILSSESSRSFLMAKIVEPYRASDSAARRISERLGGGFGVYTWMELQRSQYLSFESTRQMLLFIMALVVAVAAVNVSSATSMLVIERRKDIAILKSFGLGPGGIRSVFLSASLLTGLLGAILGIAAGLGIGCSINGIIRGLERLMGWLLRPFTGESVRILDPAYYLENIPVVVRWPAVAAIGVGTVACSVLAAWAPARRAGKLNPTEIIRKI